MVLEQPVDLGNLHSRPCGNAPLARGVDGLGIAALTRGHGADHGDLTPDFFFIGLRRRSRLAGELSGQFFHEGAQAAHFFDLLQLVVQVLEVEVLTLLEFAGQLFRLLAVDAASDVLHERQDIPHPQDS